MYNNLFASLFDLAQKVFGNISRKVTTLSLEALGFLLRQLSEGGCLWGFANEIARHLCFHLFKFSFTSYMLIVFWHLLVLLEHIALPQLVALDTLDALLCILMVDV